MHASGLEPSLVGRLYERAGASRWTLGREQFATALETSLAHARSTGSGPASAGDYLESLHLEDLALATACAAGLEPAWEHFMAEHRAALGRAAAAIDPAGGTDLADSVYADLFGLQVRRGERQSLFRYFHGRSKLGTWLRAVLAQRHIDRIRATRRHDPLPDDDAGGGEALQARAPGPDGDRTRFLTALRAALIAAISALAPRDRLRLSCYYAEDMTLAAIGRMLQEHEATVSRHLTRARREIRDAAEASLRRDHHFDDRAIAECFRTAAEDAGALDLADLFGTRAARKEPAPQRSKG